ncbi:hypothetical protein TSACC_22750 [Terrimicrobium sacchariphilum]|uniref:Uncharacterized protein n=1 Tax=Terrimicrobium sacchariphilum TaxID=690879 RepID=A0A146G9I9_TERSA|nr:hypothetical protein TSACC_22750 [Terrimicrobium sacchariphilum]
MAFLFIAVVLVALRGEATLWVSRFPSFNLYNLGLVSSARITGPYGLFDLQGLAPPSEQGQQLTISVSGDQIEIPWTMYLPVYQFGTITGRRTFDVSLSQIIKRGDTIETQARISSFRLIPNFSRAKEVRRQLDLALMQAIRARVDEGNKANHGS